MCISNPKLHQQERKKVWENQINKQKEDKKTMKSQTPRSQQTEVPEVFWHSAIRYVLSSARSRGHLLVVWFIFSCHLHVLPHRLNSAGPLSSLSSTPPFSSPSSYHPPRYPEPCSSFSPRLTKDPPQIKPVCSVLPYVSCRVLFPGQEPEVLIMNWVRFITCNYLCVWYDLCCMGEVCSFRYSIFSPHDPFLTPVVRSSYTSRSSFYF